MFQRCRLDAISCSRRSVISSMLLIFLASVSVSQTTEPNRPKTVAADKQPSAKLKKKYVKKLQDLADQTSAVEPKTRAFMLQQIARALQGLDKDEASKTILRALRATLDIDESSEQRGTLQRNMMEQLKKLDLDAAVRIFPELSSKMTGEIRAGLIEALMEQKKVEPALEILGSTPDSEEFPYRATNHVLAGLEPGSPDRSNLFIRAARAYHNRPEHMVGPGDFGDTVARFAKYVPPEIALNAIDDLLQAAKDTDKEHRVYMDVHNSEGGAVAFSSRYEFRLFQLMPVLKELDPSHANSLMDENLSTRALIKQYSQGLASFSESKKADGDANKSSYTYANYSRNPNDVVSRVAGDEQLKDMQAQLEPLIQSNPRQAMAAASSFPFSLQANILGKIISRYIGVQPPVAIEAADAYMKLTEGRSPLLMCQIRMKIINTYLAHGLFEKAEDVLHDTLATAQALYKVDTDLNHPNKAPMYQWPSLGVYSALVDAAAKLPSKRVADEVFLSIQEPDIKLMAEIMQCSRELGVPQRGWFVTEKTEEGWTSSLLSMESY